MCVDLIGPYTFKGEDGTENDFMCHTMIDPASSRFEVRELPVTTDAIIPTDTKGKGALSLITILSYHSLTNHLQ